MKLDGIDKENKELNPSSALSFDSEHRLRSENLAWDIDVWYPRLEEFTFETIFLPLKLSEAKAIRAYHDVSWRHAQEELTAEEILILQRLEADIQENLTNWQPAQADGVFMRLCGRSPKDGEPVNRERIWREYEDILSKLIPADRQLSDLELANVKMNAVAKVSWLHVYDGKDAMSLLLTSERVYAEMIDWLRFGEPEQLCFRVWEKQLTIDYEFRLFVYQGALTAISQYDHYTHYPHLFLIRDKLQQELQMYWSSVHPHVSMPDSSYIIDIAYLPQSDAYKVVEINPYSPCTGAGLFSWQYDKEVLEGRAPFEFRLKTFESLHPQLPYIVEINWDMRWKEEKAPYWLLYEKSKQTNTDSKSSTSLLTMLWNTLTLSPPSTVKQSQETPKSFLFVYGTLKLGYHWNEKYLSKRFGADLICSAVTKEKYLLFMGESGVPYLLLGDPLYPADRQIVLGEIWSVDEETLQGLDEYEGLSKGYYQRISIALETKERGDFEAFVYILNASVSSLGEVVGPLQEYSLEMHHQHYNPIRHILRKQVTYFGSPSTWGKVDKIEANAIDRPIS